MKKRSKDLKFLTENYHIVNIIHPPDSEPQEEPSIRHVPVGQVVDARTKQRTLQRVASPTVEELGDAEMST